MPPAPWGGRVGRFGSPRVLFYNRFLLHSVESIITHGNFGRANVAHGLTCILFLARGICVTVFCSLVVRTFHL